MPVPNPSIALLSSWQGFVGPASGHLWTIWGHLERGLSPSVGVDAESFATWVTDPHLARVRLTGILNHARTTSSEKRLLVLVHGLGGSSRSGYMRAAAQVALESGFTTLSLNLRGADDHGSDFYHAGLSADLRAVLEHPSLTEFSQVYVLGFSLGGHVTLRTALGPLPQRVRAVAAVCPPLDLAASARAFDERSLWIYRRHVLNGLKAMYRRFRQTSESSSISPSHFAALPSIERAMRISSIQEWDARIVAPRHGFSSRDEYYTTQSVGHQLKTIARPTLLVTTRWDPMVPWTTTEPFLQCSDPPHDSFGFASYTLPLRALSAHVHHAELLTGGHVAFPRARDRMQQPSTLLHAVIQWLGDQGARSR